MLRRREVKFEVVVEADGKPSIDGVFVEEQDAIERAKYLLTLAKYSVVRVSRVNQAGREETIFEKKYMGGGKVTTISPIDEAAFCTDVTDVFGFDSRMTLLRLFRRYWDEQVVIPAEQLHRYYPLRYFEREQTLFNTGLSRLAALQAPRAGVNPFQRQDELARMFNKLKELAQESDILAPFDKALGSGGVTGLLADIAAKRPPEERDRLVTHAFSVALEPARDWQEKVKVLLRFHEEDAPPAIAVTDELLAEMLDGREPIRALIGYAPDLASALQALLATVRGDLDDRLPNTEVLLSVSNVMGGGGYERTRAALLNRVQGGLEGTHPLTRTGQAADYRACQALVDQLAGFDGFLGGPPIAAAITLRAKTAFRERDHDLPFEETVQRLSSRLGGAAARIGYLLDLATSPYGRRRISYLVERLTEQFNRVKSAAELAAPGTPLDAIRSGLGRKLRNAGIPRALADALVAKIASIPDHERALPTVPPVTETTVEIRAARLPARRRLMVSINGQRFVMPKDTTELVIGRAVDSHVVLDVASASRRHAVITYQKGEFVLSDSSRNGTRLLEDKAEPLTLENGRSAPLRTRGEIVIGSPSAGEVPVRIAWEVVS